MWLPIDERNLLVGYYVNICNPDDKNAKYINEKKWFSIDEWTTIFARYYRIPILGCRRVKRAAPKIKGYFDGKEDKSDNKKDDPDFGHMREKIKKEIFDQGRLEFANMSLEKRKLIGIKKHTSEKDVVGISLTLEGYDLGRKYSGWWDRTGQWFVEYRNHWIWLIVTFLGGILATLATNKLLQI